MISKAYSKTGRVCRVTFRIPPGSGAERASLVGSFNEWNADAHPMTRRKDGSFSVTVTLPAGRRYALRYLLDGTRWLTDPEADEIVDNPYGEKDGVIAV